MTAEEKQRLDQINENTKIIMLKISSIIITVGDIVTKISNYDKIENMRDMIMENLCCEVEQLKKHYIDLDEETKIISKTLKDNIML